MNSTGMNTATSESVIERMVKPISREPSSAASQRRLAHLHVAHDVLEHHDGVVHHEADRQRERHQREVVEAVAEQLHDRERADDRQRQRQARDHRGRAGSAGTGRSPARRGRASSSSVNFTSVHRIADRDRAVVAACRARPRPAAAARSAVEQRLHRVGDLRPCSCRAGAGSRARWRAGPLNQLADLVVLHAVDDLRRGRRSRTGAPLRYATTIAPKSCGVLELAVRLDREGALAVPRGCRSAGSRCRRRSRPPPRRCRCRATASARGSSWMRTAYFCAPNTCTCATPFTVEMRCASVVSAYSSSCRQRQQSSSVSAR